MEKGFTGSERRRFERVEVNFLVLYRVNSPIYVRMKVGDIDVDAVALNLSENGIAILTNYDIPASTIVTIRFTVINDMAVTREKRTKSLVVQGEVRNNNFSREAKSHRIGICFKDLSEEGRTFISDFVKGTSFFK